MRRLVIVAAILLGVAAPGTANADTGTYSTGNLDVPIGASLDRSVTVPQHGPVSFVRVSFRITTPDTSALSVSLVSPKGTVVPLVAGRGAGADFGSGAKDCGGILTVVDSDMTTNPISAGQAPFTDNTYRPEGKLSSLYGQDAHGRWTLRIENTGAPARLGCFVLDVSRAVPKTMSAHRGSVRATVSFVERDYLFQHMRLKVVRGGRTVLDGPISKAGCRDCADFRPVDVKVRDLDGGEPEVLLDLYSGGAHCCMLTLILRWDAAAKRYRSKLAYWGNYGSRLTDVNGDGLPEFSAFDERFVYTFTAYVFSAAPIQIWSYRQGKLVDVTRDYPALIRKDAAGLLKTYEQGRKQKGETDVRAFVAAYVADQYLLGDQAEGKRLLDLALKRGDLGRGKTLLGSPAGTRFVSVLMTYLRKWGYTRP